MQNIRFALDMTDPTTAFALVVVLLVAILIPYLVWEMKRGKARGHWWFNRMKPRGHGDIGPDLGDRATSNPYSGEAQVRR